MKKFKGGLYADLGNYKTSLPNTEILNNFFASNPVGYRSGGIVKGVAGGNPTGMKVTGGFLSNAQRYASGSKDAVSAYYKTKRGDAIRPGRLESQYMPRFRTSGKNVGTESAVIPPFERVMLGETGKDLFYPYATSEDFAESKPFGTGRGLGEKETERRKKDLPEYEKQLEKKESSGIEAIPVGGMLPGGEKEKAIYGEGYKQYQKDQKGFLDPKKIITKSDDSSSTDNKDKKPALTPTERDSSKDSVLNGKSVFDKMTEEGLLETPKDAQTMVDELFTNNEDYQKLINNYSEASEADKAALKKIGEEYYGKDKGKEAPAWAMPLMMMGLNMAASNNPDMLGAMAEGGIKGVEQYAKQQKEKKDEAKEKIELDLKKINKSIEINSRDLDFTKDMATIKSNIINQSMQIASNEMINYNNNLRTAIQADSDRELEEYKIKEQSMINWAQLDAKYDIANTEIDFKYMELMDKKEARKDDLTYKQDVLKVEIAKHNNDWQKHLNLVNLEKVSTGKTTTIMMPDNEGNSVQTKVHVYLNKETGEFETKVLGFAPPDAEYL